MGKSKQLIVPAWRTNPFVRKLFTWLTYNQANHVLKASLLLRPNAQRDSRKKSASPTPIPGNTGITCHLLNSLMSENEQPGQDLLEVEGILDLNEKNTGTCSTPLEEAKLRRTTPFCQRS